MKKVLVLIVIILAAAAGFVLGARLLTSEDTWLCVDNQWIKHGQPSTPMPLSGCGEDFWVSDPRVRNLNVKTNDKINLPFELTGEARGTWYFEASFPVRLETADGRLLTQAVAQAKSDWMTEEFVPFGVTLDSADPYVGAAVLILQRDNPSGLPENDAQVKIRINLE